MSIPEHYLQMLRTLIQSFMVAGISRSDFLDQVTSLSREIYESRPGARAKHKQWDVFKALENWVEQARAEDRERPREGLIKSDFKPTTSQNIGDSTASSSKLRINQSFPSQNKMVQFLIERFQYKESRATELARIFRLWYLKDVTQLTKADQSFLKKTFGREWRELQTGSKVVEEAFAAQREAQALLRLMNEVPTLLQLAEHASRPLPNKARRTPKA